MDMIPGLSLRKAVQTVQALQPFTYTQTLAEEIPRSEWKTMAVTSNKYHQLCIPDLSQKEAVSVGVGLLNGLSLLHSLGYVHSDIKTENIMLTTNGTVVVGWCGDGWTISRWQLICSDHRLRSN